MKMLLATFSLLVIICGNLVQGHVILTYPPARKYQLDFIDSFRTLSPCGMPEGIEGSVTTAYQRGTTVNVTWHLSYPHKGGYKLELLQNNQVTHTLAPSSGDWAGTNDGTTIHHAVTLPSDVTCDKCTLRLVRQAVEWGTSYRFHSCADIRIQESADTTCSGHGAWGNTCQCNNMYYGTQCHFKNECEEDVDCSNGGKCVSIESTLNAKKQCFCAAGFHGENCAKVSKYADINVNYASYQHKALVADVFDLYYKYIDKDKELEIILKVMSTTWIAIGWKPNDLTPECQGFPVASGSLRSGRTEKHAMDCTDIIIGSARGEYSRIFDYYTRDRSTPRLDTFYPGGSNSLQGAIGIEENGMTIIRFSRKVAATEKTDHTIQNKTMTIIYARGQELGHYIHIPASSYEANTVGDREFYKPDQIKYHGQRRQRGSLSLNLLGPETPNTPGGAGSFGSPLQGWQVSVIVIGSICVLLGAVGLMIAERYRDRCIPYLRHD